MVQDFEQPLKTVSIPGLGAVDVFDLGVRDALTPDIGGLQITDPNGGEDWETVGGGWAHNVVWLSDCFDRSNVDIYLTTDYFINPANLVTIAGEADDGSAAMTDPGVTSTTAMVYICKTSDRSIRDRSNNEFEVS